MLKLTQSYHTTWNREQYLQASLFAGRTYIMTPGGLNDNTSKRFYYDPYTSDANDDTFMYFPAGTDVSTLNWDYLKYWQQYLGYKGR